jgi:hypothetical protein
LKRALPIVSLRQTQGQEPSHQQSQGQINPHQYKPVDDTLTTNKPSVMGRGPDPVAKIGDYNEMSNTWRGGRKKGGQIDENPPAPPKAVSFNSTAPSRRQDKPVKTFGAQRNTQPTEDPTTQALGHMDAMERILRGAPQPNQVPPRATLLPNHALRLQIMRARGDNLKSKKQLQTQASTHIQSMVRGRSIRNDPVIKEIQKGKRGILQAYAGPTTPAQVNTPVRAAPVGSDFTPDQQASVSRVQRLTRARQLMRGRGTRLAIGNNAPSSDKDE